VSSGSTGPKPPSPPIINAYCQMYSVQPPAFIHLHTSLTERCQRLFGLAETHDSTHATVGDGAECDKPSPKTLAHQSHHPLLSTSSHGPRVILALSQGL
jgi:hypothetical protein